MSLTVIALLPLMVMAVGYVLMPVVRWLDPPRMITEAYGFVMLGATLIWLAEVAVYCLGSLFGGFR